MEEAITPSRAAAGGGEGVAGGADALGGGVEDDAEAVFGGDARGAGVDAGEELVGEGGDDEQRGAGAAEAEVAGGEVGPVAEVAGGGPGRVSAVRSETRPRHLSPRTRETVAWETPAARATSRLVGRARLAAVRVRTGPSGRSCHRRACACCCVRCRVDPRTAAHGTYDRRRYT